MAFGHERQEGDRMLGETEWMDKLGVLVGKNHSLVVEENEPIRREDEPVQGQFFQAILALHSSFLFSIDWTSQIL